MTQRQWIICIRVSKVGDREGDSYHSPDEQREACRAFINEAGDTVLTEFLDEDVSGMGTIPGRNAALALLQQDPATRGIVSRDWSRLGRNVKDFLAFVDAVNTVGGAVATTYERIDTTTAAGRLQLTVLAGMHEYQARAIGERWRGIQQRRLARGLPGQGGARFGYDREEGGVYTPSPVTGPALADAYRRFNRGDSPAGIVRALNEAGLTTVRGKPWTAPRLLQVLGNGFAAGLIHVHSTGEYLPGKHEPLITREEWEAYQRRYDSRRRVGPRARNPEHMLAGLIRCGLCGGAMVRVHDARIRCGRRQTCRGVSIRRELVEGQVGVWLGGWLEDLARHGESVQNHGEAYAAARARVTALDAERVRLEVATARLASQLAEDLIDRATFIAARDEFRARLAAVERDRREAEEEIDRLAQPPRDVYDRFKAATEGFEIGAWNTLIRTMVREVAVTWEEITVVPITGEPVVYPRPKVRVSRKDETVTSDERLTRST